MPSEVASHPMNASQDITFSVSEFVAVLNQTLEYAYGGVTIVGELANLRVSKNRWVYFDLKDDASTVKFFGTVQQLPGPLENGMLIKVRGQPRLHSLYGFSVHVQTMQPVGEGSIRKAADLLRAKLASEGLFDPERKRRVPYPPRRIGLITSKQSAAYADFVKIIAARWQSLQIDLIDVQVQGEVAPEQIVAAFEQFNAQAIPPDVLVLIRGGGSPEDLAAFSTEVVTRAVAASRVPTVVAIGHEIDQSLAELAADRPASTPSNAAELLVPDRKQVKQQLNATADQLDHVIMQRLGAGNDTLREQSRQLLRHAEAVMTQQRQQLTSSQTLLEAYNPQAILQRGYALVRYKGTVVRSTQELVTGAIVDIELADGHVPAAIAKEADGKVSKKS